MDLRQSYLDAVKDNFLAQKKTIIFCFCTVFFWGLLAHAYGFLNNSFSHDALNAFAATAVEENIKIARGRYLVPLYRLLFRGPITIPWLIGLLGLTWTAVAFFLVVQIFKVRSRVLAFLIGGIMTTNITYSAQIATYIHEFDCNALAMLLSVMAIYAWDRDKKYLSILLGGICLMAAIGIYQAYLAVAVTLIVWKSIMDLLDDVPVQKVFGKGIRGILTIVAGGLFYVLLGKVVALVTTSTPKNGMDVFAADGESLIAMYLGLIKPVISYLGRNILHKVFYSDVFDACVYILVAALVLLTVRAFICKKYRIDRILLILVLVAVTPLAMSCVFFLAKGEEMHDITTYVLWFFYVFVLLLAFRFCEESMNPDWKTNIVRIASCVLVVIVLWQNVVFANTAYIKKNMEAESALSTMTRVVSRLEDREDYIPGETPVAFIGIPRGGEHINGMERFGTIISVSNGSTFYIDVSVSHYNTYKAYFNYVLQTPACFCSDAMHSKLKKDERVQAMPTYPHKDSIAMIDGVLVIKMG